MDKIAALTEEMNRLKKFAVRMLEAPDQQLSLTDPDARSMKSRGVGIVGYNVQTAVVERAAVRLAAKPDAMRIRRATIEHPYGTLKAWMGSTHFLTKALDHVSTEMSLQVLAYNMKRVINLVGTKQLLEAI
jgi:hypothetical protein